MELDLQRFYNINRRVVMWVAFFAILYLIRDFFALTFLTFILGYSMRSVAQWMVRVTRLPYRLSVIIPYVAVISLLVVLMMTAIPRIVDEGVKFSQRVPVLLQTLSQEIEKTATKHGLQPALAKYLDAEAEQNATADAISVSSATTIATQPAVETDVDTRTMTRKLRGLLAGLIPRTTGQGGSIEEAFVRFVASVGEGTLQFLLAILLSFLIVFDFDHISSDLQKWRESPVGGFFHEAAAGVVEFFDTVGSAIQCQLAIALLNASITCVGLVLLKIEPLLLLVTIVFLCGLIPVLGVFVSSVPIILIAFNEVGISHAMMALGMVVIVHLLEAYVFNPRIYAARFHLNPVIVLIILLVGHELFGVWGMLLGIPVTHYVLNIAQMPSTPRRKGKKDRSKQKTGVPVT